jgi:outer membrane lipoprotein SlyB
MNLRILCVVSLMALALGGGLSAQTNNTNTANADQPQTMTSTATGTVVSSDSGSLVIDTGNGRQTFMVDSSSNLPANLTPGSRVSVQYHTLSGNQLHAGSVSVLSGGTAPSTRETNPTTENPPTTTGTTGSQATGTTGSMGSTETISGTVVSSSPTALVIRTDSGQRRFVVDAQSTVPADVARGASVSVDYHILPGNRFHAASVTMLSAAPSTGVSQTTTEPSTTTSGTETRTARNLPATASSLPLVALIGLASLTAALALRTLARRRA